MTEHFTELMWWITAVEIPVLSALFWMIWRDHRESERNLRHVQEVLETRTAQMREALSAYKLEVAKSYARGSDLKDLEERLIGHLLRIEGKLDTTALKAEALRGEARGCYD